MVVSYIFSFCYAIVYLDILSYQGMNEDCNKYYSANIQKSISIPIVYYGQEHTALNVS